MRRNSVKSHIRAIKGLYIHSAIYIIGTLVLLTLNAFTGHPFWSIFPVLGWGLGIAIHALSVLVAPRIFSARWEARQARQWHSRNLSRWASKSTTME